MIMQSWQRMNSLRSIRSMQEKERFRSLMVLDIAVSMDIRLCRQQRWQKKEKQWILDELKNESRTIIIYEAPHRLVRTLEELKETLGNRRLTICRELTKKYEEAYQTTFEEALARYEVEEPKGECVLVIEGKSIAQKKEELAKSWEEMTLEEHMEMYESQGIDHKEAMRRVAKDRGISKRDVYQQLL